MMAADTNTSPVRITIFFALLLLITEDVSSETQTTPSVLCAYGTYKHEGRSCCLCGIGQRLVEHCTTTHHGKCEACEDGYYSSHPTNQFTCEPCTSCSHQNENLELDEPCTRGRDAKCRCQKDHYCASSTQETCKLCFRCKQCGPEGIKEACSGRNNTICNEEGQGGAPGGTIAGTIIGLILVGAIIAGVAYFLIKRKKDSRPIPARDGSDPHDIVVNDEPLLLPKDLQPLLHDISVAIGWKDMEEVAMRTNIPSTTIESCKLDHPGESEEQTRKLLKIWVESVGRDAAKRLIEILKASGKKLKAEKVQEILARGS